MYLFADDVTFIDIKTFHVLQGEEFLSVVLHVDGVVLEIHDSLVPAVTVLQHRK